MRSFGKVRCDSRCDTIFIVSIVIVFIVFLLAQEMIAIWAVPSGCRKRQLDEYCPCVFLDKSDVTAGAIRYLSLPAQD